MSHGPGKIERLIGELFAATKGRALSITDLTSHAFTLAGAPPTRPQRLSATRAAHLCFGVLWPKDFTGEPVVLTQGREVRSLAVLADGRLASGSPAQG